MKSIVLFFALISCSIGFSQELIQDPFSGMEMELSGDKQFLKVVRIEPGTPADLSPIVVGNKIIRIDDQIVSEIHSISNYFISRVKQPVKFSIRNGNGVMKEITIPRVSVDLFSGNFVNEYTIYRQTNLSQQIIANSWDMDLKGRFAAFDQAMESLDDPRAYQGSTSRNGNNQTKSCTYFPKLNTGKSNQLTVLADYTKDLSAYTSYDFEFSSQVDPMMEKVLLNKVGTHLINMGLTQKSQDPDILVIISFYSGQKEQYVPPQQIVSTKILSYYNWYWGYIPVPVTESKTKGGYTDVSYLTTISLKFLEAHKIVNSKVPPVIWSASYSEISKGKAFISDAAEDIFKILLHQFPRVTNENAENIVIDSFTNTGIIFQNGNVADVIPGSAADRAGIMKGDMLQKLDYRYIFYGSNIKDGDPRLFDPLDWKKNRQSASQAIVFQLKRNGKKISIPVTPEYRKGLYFEGSGYVLD